MWLACSSESFAPEDDNSLQLLKDKHPPPHPGSAGGPDDLRPQHLKDIIITSPFREGSLDLISVLADFVNLVLAGKVPPTVCPYFFGASLIGLGRRMAGLDP